MAGTYFKPYEGEQPYIFISYAHADAARVMPIAADLHDRGFRVWYDEGIAAGSEWTESIAQHLSGAALMIGFVSPAYIASANCRREMNFAVQRKIHLINIFLERTELTPGLELQVGGIWALMKYEFHSEDYFYRKLYEAPAMLELSGGEVPPAPTAPRHVKRERPAKAARPRPEAAPVPPKKRKSRRVSAFAIILVLLVAVVALAFVGDLTGFTGRLRNRLFGAADAVAPLPDDTVAVFTNQMVEAAARQYSGKGSGDVTVGDLEGLTELYFCGAQYSFSQPYEAPDAPTGESSYTTADGSTVERGMIVSLADFAYFPSLTTLQVSYQVLTNLETLPSCNLTTLIVSSDRLTSLAGVERLPLLTALDAAHSPITDVTGVSACTRLESIDLTGSAVTDWTEFKSLPELKNVKLSGADFTSLKPLLMLPTLTGVELTGCDLRGDFFDRMDSRKLTMVKLTDCTIDTLAGVGKLSSLSELWLIRVSGVTDFALLGECPALQTVHADESMMGYFGATSFTLVEEKAQ